MVEPASPPEFDGRPSYGRSYVAAEVFWARDGKSMLSMRGQKNIVVYFSDGVVLKFV
jgi:hypothetical protein